MRPEDLAPQLGISAKHLRSWLRKTYPRPLEMKHQPWNMTEAQVRSARGRFEGGPRRAESREDMRVTSVALPSTTHERLSETAQRLETPMTELVRIAVADWLKRNHLPRGGR